jgi:aminoglycoside 3-N-acetyltransferase
MDEGSAPVEPQPRGPVTIEMLVDDLRVLGVSPGSTVIVHSSLRSLGWVVGGVQSVITALLGVLGESGTLVVPTHSSDRSDPAEWSNPPVPADWWPIIREAMPAFDPVLTPLRQMGAIPEGLLRLPGVRRSQHPWVSFAAVGPHAQTITGGHSLTDSLGEGSPLARIYEQGGSILLIGVGHDSDTSLHLAEYRATWPSKRRLRRGAPMLLEGTRQWVEYDDVEIDDSDFPTIGAAYLQAGGVAALGKLGHADAQLFDQRSLVDYAVQWMSSHRS